MRLLDEIKWYLHSNGFTELAIATIKAYLMERQIDMKSLDFHVGQGRFDNFYMWYNRIGWEAMDEEDDRWF